jgi:hypothetical protein
LSKQYSDQKSLSKQNSDQISFSKTEESPADGDTKIKSGPSKSDLKNDQKKSSIETRKVLANAAALAASILEV